MAFDRSTLLNRVRLLGLIVALVTACTACRVDVDISVTVNKDGSGTIVLAAEADAEVVQQAPDLAKDLRFDDAIAAGWTVTSPVGTATGGMQITLTHPFKSTGEATQLLASINGINGPLHDVSLSRLHTKTLTTFRMDGSVSVANDLNTFADDDLLAAIGATTPYAAEVAARQLTTDQALGITLHAKLPGNVVSSTGTPVDDQLAWIVPVSGTPLLVTTRTEQAEKGNSWASPLATGARLALVAWCIVAALFIFWVFLARRRRLLRRGGRLG